MELNKLEECSECKKLILIKIKMEVQLELLNKLMKENNKDYNVIFENNFYKILYKKK